MNHKCSMFYVFVGSVLLFFVCVVMAVKSFAATTPATAMSNESAATYTLAGAAKYCADLNESAQTDWYLPVAEDLIHFADAADTSYLWTKSFTTAPRGFLWVRLRLSDGQLDYQSAEKLNYVRCVR